MAPPDPSSPDGRAGANAQNKLLTLLLYGLPPLTVLVVGFALLVAGAPRPFLFARVLGGPTDGSGPWSGRIQLMSRDGDVDEPAANAPLRVEWSAGGHTTVRSAVTDAEGWAEVLLERPLGAKKLDLSVYGGELGVLAVRGAPELSAARWRHAARRRSGVLETSPDNAQELRVAVRVVDGVLAVPFEGPLEIEVREGAEPVIGAVLEWTPQGLDMLSASPLVTDARGQARVVVRPREHVVSLGLTATAPVSAPGAAERAAHGRWYSHLPLVAGALHARVQDAELVIESPTVRESAWYAFVSQTERLRGGRVQMRPTGRGGSIGSVPLAESGVTAPPAADRWLVVSGDPDGRSPSTVGWPWGNQATTFDALDALLLDGSRFGQEREDARRSRVRWVVGIYCAVAALLTLVLFVRRVRGADRELTRQLAGAGAAAAVPSHRSLTWGLVVAVLCVLLGFLVVALVSLARAH